ncbi:hypothetical protein GCM10010497_59070 [Streptomyces cinereoruber]|uniref:Endonuclease n=1 Tax=Streptomyces cinereoruber TaxID=67260 RepID=A0AAV4KU11_9ACTN|nr:endonuclease/exonuclease/phosphatase family protein [Streptomyces cinereoruber]MBB4161743.1 endonuclease/exonuclease/phosphatase family metal-dependent hydrolase [Streptomyces cinereoruber]MBY8820058.1 FG-GAP-like repeat-containing protein [Streptomyces cinereoruber]NIH65428.1 endonuclease/exonuclease/phosphatase family metal-dependent hydrolase [Streptomyces cinereoruber]QEV30850.1 endonuclease [Streptomyces cinereoruber]GGR47889.1 hypothetical protein GCM10010497_59070 [Streptomyces ciner
MRRRKTFTLLLALLVALGVVQPAVADAPSPSTAPVVRFLSYNICGNSDNKDACSLTREVEQRRDKVVQEARAWKADLIFLQEVCRQQYDGILGSLTPEGYDGYFVPTLTRSDVCNVKGLNGTVTNGAYGIAVLAKGPLTGGTGVPLDPDDAYTNTYSGPEEWYAACVEARIQSVRTRACSVHLYPQYLKTGEHPVVPADINATQAKNLAANPWLNAGTPVVLGGDFNPVNRNPGGSRANAPRSSDLDPFYRPALGGTGRFIETDETDADHFDCAAPLPDNCRSGEFTNYDASRGTQAKLDYVFVDEAHFKNVAADAKERDPRISDHYPYLGAATFSHCNNPADGKADMLRRDAAGDLWRHFGRADGKIAADPCKIGVGWTGMQHIARTGAAGAGGVENLYAIDGAGNLRFYPGDPTELYFRAPRILGGGWGDVRTMAVSPDSDGDGNPELIIRRDNGTLWRVPTRQDGTVGTLVSLAGAEGWGTGTYNTILAPGDIDGDSRPDILARTPAGDLFLYAGRTDGTLAARTRIGTGWNIYNTIVAPGNFDGDGNGRPDLLGRKQNGDVFFYAGTGNAAAPFVNPPWPHQNADRSGWGFDPTDLLF